MNGVLRPDLANTLMIGLIAFAAVWVINRAARAANMPMLTTSGG